MNRKKSVTFATIRGYHFRSVLALPTMHPQRTPLRLLALSILFIFGIGKGWSQTATVWSVNFNNGCTNDCIANTYGGWSILNNDGGVSGGSANDWFVSCAEEGVVPPGCGTTCVGDASLHIGADPGAGGDMGASFNETGIANATFKTAVSPTVSTVGFITNTLAFDFIAFGSASCSDDRAQLRLSTDNGATWPVGFQYCLTSVCCGACNGYSQGQWTTYTLALPAAFNNNPNVRVGFNWRNNGNGSGTDPSVAIDDVRITSPLLPVRMLSFQAKPQNADVKLNWSVTEEIQVSRYEIERSTEPQNFKLIGAVTAKGHVANGGLDYIYRDAGALAGTLYYRLRMVDQNGSSNFSNILRVTPGAMEALELSAFSQSAYQNMIDMDLWAIDAMIAHIEVRDLQGRLIINLPNQNLVAGRNPVRVDLSEKAAAAYLISIKSTKLPMGYAPVHISRKFVLVH